MISRLCQTGRARAQLRLLQMVPAINVTPKACLVSQTTTNPDTAAAIGFKSTIGEHAKWFKIERYWAVAMFPLFPAAYFIHNPTMDMALTIAIVLHVHWGVTAVIQDYARATVVGESFSKIAPKFNYLISILLLAALLQFNYNDVGLTKAFEMFFRL
ncbi:cybS, succinate dehydrogenase cytochrome B small subunit domain-containing protein [Ditylenchus destructor]|nr:cybS, succinate dehydrogenase cytochrome B small subunit domain-containing protein [Ditylenchus destructor]